jgi:murein DD-endopeptidase MepM/ murein hydrolase activator NlpD
MTGAFMLPALTGTNEALSKFTNVVMGAMVALSTLTTIAQVRGIGGVGGMSLGKKSRTLQSGLFGQDSSILNPKRVQGKVGMSHADSLALAKEKAGAGKVMGGLANKATGVGKGAIVARAALQALTVVTGPIGIAAAAAIALGTAAFVAYQKSIDNAKKAGESLYAEQTKAAEYYGIELQNVNTSMAENVKIAKEMGLAAAPTAATVDPALKQSILEQEENKKLVEEIKKSNDPASIFLGQYGKMLQQGFSPDQAKEVLSILAQASGKMGALQGISGTLNSTVVTGKDGEVDVNATAIKATEAVGQAAIGNINSLFSKKMPSGLSFTDTSTGQVYNTREQALEARGLPEFASLDTMSQKEFNLLTETERQQAKDNGAFITNRTEGEMVATKLSGDKDFANLTGQITMAFKSALMSPDLGVGYETMGATIEQTFKKAAETGTNIDDVAAAMGDSAKAMAKELGFEDDSKFVETMNSALENTEDKAQGAKDQMLLIQAAAAGIDLTTVVADGELAADEAERLRKEVAAIDTQKQINITVNTQIQDAIDAIDEEIQVRTAYYDQLIANNEEAQDSENERTKNFQKNMEKRNKAIQKEIKEIRKAADEQIDAKEKEIDVIEESSDKYLESLESQKEESSFFASQRQTALGGLSSLASGDVVGFLQAREEMAAASQENSQQNEIDKIEQITEARITDIEKTIDAIKEQADAEIGTLQEQLEKNQELMDKEGERHEKRMESLQKEALKIQQNKSAEIKAFDDAKGKLQELMDMPVGEKLGKDLGAYADAISEVASNMPASAQDTMTKLATSFGDNFQSVFDAELAASAAEYGVDPTQLKDLVKRSLPGKDLPPHKRARGGYISGPGTSTSDSIPTMLSNGEYVVKADSVKRIGKGTLDKINSGSGGMSTRYGGMATRTDTTEGYRVGGGEAISAASAFAGGVKTAVLAINAGNALASAAASAMDEEPGNDNSSGSGRSSSISEKLGQVARILRGSYPVTARGTYPRGGKHRARYSTAIDYGTPTGTPVYAMAGGKFRKSYSASGYGKFATIGHNDDTESLYAHLDGYANNNRNVNAGDLIGYTGNTGVSSGPHLHFEWSALKEGFNPPGMKIGGETTSDGIAKLHKGEMVLTKPLTQTLKDGISDLRFGVPSAPSTSGVGSSGTMVSDNRVINVNVNASGSGMNPDMVAQRIVSAINKQENRRSFGRFS